MNKKCKLRTEPEVDVPEKKICQREAADDEPRESTSLSQAVFTLGQDKTSTCRKCLPYRGPNVLILGDGNLSFSGALALMYPEFKLTASVIEDRAQFIERYPSGLESIEKLLSLPNVELQFEVDATKIPIEWKGKYNDIIMNFPHPGGKTNLKRCRELMNNIFASLQHIMTEDCRFHLSLAKRQSGLEHSAVLKQQHFSSELPVHNKDSWQIIYTAASYDMIADSVIPFDPTIFHEYLTSGYKNRDQKFWNSEAADLISFSCLPYALSSLPSPVPIQDSACFPKNYHSFRPFFRHDISILYRKSSDELAMWESLLFRFIVSRTAGLVVDLEEVESLRCVCPKSALANRIYRLYWQSVSAPLHRTLCNQLQNDLRDAITRYFADESIPLILS